MRRDEKKLDVAFRRFYIEGGGTEGMMPKLIEKISAALNGERLVTSGYGTYLLSAKVWEKNGKSRIYFDGRFIDSDGHISKNVQRLGHIEFFSGEVIYDTKSYHESAFRDLVEPAIAAILQP
jgi:hypothetical protein